MPEPASQGNGSLNLRFSLRLLLRLQHCGVRHVVISPGSRSTPLTLAAAMISGDGLLQTHVLLDERSAGFFAAGLSKASGTPAVLICTSGTAGANYYPAVAEASMTSTPLIIITADRPPELQGKMAPQTMNQRELFGAFTQFFEQTGPDFYAANTPEKAFSLADSIFRNAMSAGPVHLNAGFRKPLEPAEADALKTYRAVTDERDSHLAFKHEKPETKESEKLFGEILNRIQQAENPVVISGPLNTGSTAERFLLRLTLRKFSIPHLLEATSGEQTNQGEGQISRYEMFLRQDDVLERLKPDFILRVGFPPVSQALNLFLKKNREVVQWCFSSTPELPDPTDTCSRFIQVPVWMPHLSLPEAEKSGPSHSPRWLQQWKEQEARAGETLKNMWANTEASSPLTDGRAVRLLSGHINRHYRNEHLLFTGNSFSVRDADLFSAGPLPFKRVFHNRGVSGIDGITSSAHGCSVAEGSPLWLFLGDLSFLHDSNGLLHLSRHKGAPVVVVVFNNEGGTIFRMLPVASHKKHYRTYFETPQTTDIPQLCRAHGLSVQSCRTEEELQAVLNAPGFLQLPVTIIELKTDANRSMAERRNLWNIKP